MGQASRLATPALPHNVIAQRLPCRPVSHELTWEGWGEGARVASSTAEVYLHRAAGMGHSSRHVRKGHNTQGEHLVSSINAEKENGEQYGGTTV